LSRSNKIALCTFLTAYHLGADTCLHVTPDIEKGEKDEKDAVHVAGKRFFA
jgi:hypothetical protein